MFLSSLYTGNCSTDRLSNKFKVTGGEWGKLEIELLTQGRDLITGPHSPLSLSVYAGLDPGSLVKPYSEI